MSPSPFRRLALLMLGLAILTGCSGRDDTETAAMRLHVTQFQMPSGQSRLLTYSYPGLELRGEVELGDISTRMALHPAGEEIWIGSEGSRDVTVYDAARDSVIGRYPLGVPVGGIAFEANALRCLVTHGAVVAPTLSQPNATIMHCATRKPMNAFRAGKSPRGVCFEPNGGRAFVANTGDSTLSILDIVKAYTSDSLEVGQSPHDVSADPLGRWLYVPCLGRPGPEGRERGEVQVWSLPDLELLASFDAGAHPTRVTPLPDGASIVVNELRLSPNDAPRVRIFAVEESAEGPRFTLRHEIEAGDNPLSGGMSPDGRLYAVPDFAKCRLALIDLEQGKRIRWLQLPGTVVVAPGRGVSR